MQAVLDIIHPNAARDVPGTAGPVLVGSGGVPMVGSWLGGALSAFTVPIQLWCAALHPLIIARLQLNPAGLLAGPSMVIKLQAAQQR